MQMQGKHCINPYATSPAVFYLYNIHNQRFHTSLHDATALCKGVNHLLSLALTLAPATRRKKIH